MSLLKTISLIGAASLIAAGCGSSTAKPANQTINLTRAAYVSGGSSGYRTVMSLQESIPGVGQLNMTGSGRFSAADHTGAFTMDMNIPSAAAAQAGLSNARLQMVLASGTIYMKLPPQIASKLPGGKPWWKINLSQAGSAAGIPGLSSLISGTSNLNDPGQYLDFLRATAGGSVQDLGSATVNGIQTMHYHAQVDLTKLPNAVPASARAGVQQLISALQKRGAAPNVLPIDAWIDSSHLIRRIELTYNQPVATGQSVAVSMKADYLQYGPQPRPQLPPPSQTVDLLALLHQG